MKRGSTGPLLLWGMIAILVFVGGLHFFVPEKLLFLLPEWLPYKMESIYLSGVLEFILAFGLYKKNFRKIASLSTALYFIFLELFHIRVAVLGIPMLGHDEPSFLWGRVILQLPLIYWAYSLGKESTETGV